MGSVPSISGALDALGAKGASSALGPPLVTTASPLPGFEILLKHWIDPDEAARGNLTSEGREPPP